MLVLDIEDADLPKLVGKRVRYTANPDNVSPVFVPHGTEGVVYAFLRAERTYIYVAWNHPQHPLPLEFEETIKSLKSANDINRQLMLTDILLVHGIVTGSYHRKTKDNANCMHFLEVVDETGL
jgi:hypothetical protein